MNPETEFQKTPEQCVDSLRLAFTRMDWYRLERIADAIKILGADAVPQLRELAKQKYIRATGRMS